MHTRHTVDAMRRFAERQTRTIEGQRRELTRARERIRALEQALRTSCEYADVCRHNPANQLLQAPLRGADSGTTPRRH